MDEGRAIRASIYHTNGIHLHDPHNGVVSVHFTDENAGAPSI